MNLYKWFWKDLLKLDMPISWIIVQSIKDHLLVWQIVGATITAAAWILAMHFIAMK